MFLGLVDVHKLCTSVFKPKNVFSVMNIGPEKHKKADERMSFSCSEDRGGGGGGGVVNRGGRGLGGGGWLGGGWRRSGAARQQGHRLGRGR
jgi:hypothetical protein